MGLIVINEKHEVLMRLRAIELLAYWEGRLITNRLVDWFGISRQQASLDIKRYITIHNPGSLYHDPAVKGYVPAIDFKLVFTTGHINDYLKLIAEFAGESNSVTLEPESYLAAVQLPYPSVRPDVIREVLRACRMQRSLVIRYASMANPLWNDRVISPHALVYTGFRWHVRAFCHERREFCDFLISRIDRSPKSSRAQAPSQSLDSMWNEQIVLNLIANPRLKPEQRMLVENDFGMPNGRLQISTRKALANYTLQRLQAAISEEEAFDEVKYPIVLLESDRHKFSSFLFGSIS